MKFSTPKQRQEFKGGLALIRTAGQAAFGKVRAGRRLLIRWFPTEKWKAAIRQKQNGKEDL